MGTDKKAATTDTDTQTGRMLPWTETVRQEACYHRYGQLDREGCYHGYKKAVT